MYRRRSSEWIRHMDFEVADLLCVEIIYFLVAYVRLGVNFRLFSDWNLVVMFLIAWSDFLCVFIMHPYKEIIQRGYWKEFVAIFQHLSAIYVTLIVLFYMMHHAEELPRLTIGISYCLSFMVMYVLHLCMKRAIHRWLAVRRDREQLLVVSDSRHIEQTMKQILTKRYTRYAICAVSLLDGYFVLEEDEERIRNCFPGPVFVIKSKTELLEFLRTCIVDEVFLDESAEGENWDELVLQCLQMGIAVHIGLADGNMNYPNSVVEHFGDRLVISTSVQNAPSWQLAFKRVIDVCGSLVGLLITGILCIFLVPAIKMADPGPAFFKQKRVGMNGRVFDFYKFRSMYMDAEERKKELMEQNQMQGFMFKLENDPRIIGSEKGPGKGLGNFIRRTSLDEFPQFWNVLKGDMSLVGTRPPTLAEYEKYEAHHKIRLSMKPGITGMWQVSGRSNVTDFEEVVRLDTQYIQNWSIGMDIKILLKTIPVVLHMDGSR